MDRSFAIFVIILILTTDVVAQQYFKDYYDSTDQKTTPEQSAYYVVGKKILLVDRRDTLESYIDTVRAYYRSTNRLKYLHIYDNDAVLNGQFIAYYPNGRINEMGRYVDGKKSGAVTTYYPNGNHWKIIEYPAEKESISDWSETNFKVVSYRDSTGREIVKHGVGFCRCYLLSGRLEVGKVVDGFRDSIWSEYSADTLIRQEHYIKGRFIEGVYFDRSQARKYRQMEDQPIFAGGIEAMMNHIRNNLRYPKNARRMGIDGTVYVTFIVRKDGSLDDVKIMRGIGADADQEAVRVVKLMNGKWVPGRLRGVPVHVRFNLPIKFKLN